MNVQERMTEAVSATGVLYVNKAPAPGRAAVAQWHSAAGLPEVATVCGMGYEAFEKESQSPQGERGRQCPTCREAHEGFSKAIRRARQSF